MISTTMYNTIFKSFANMWSATFNFFLIKTKNTLKLLFYENQF